MSSTPKNLKAALGTPKGGVYFLSGGDEYRKEEAARALVDLHLDPSTRDFNFDLVRGSQTSFETLAVLLGTPPMMADWRVILLRETQALASSAKMRDLLVETAKAPPPGLTLILLCSIPDKSTARFYQDIAKAAKSIEFSVPNLNDLPVWVIGWARDTFRREVTEDAARALVQAIGTETGILAQEIEKLTSMVEEGGTIDLKVVEASGTRVPRQDRWKWFDLVGEKRFGEAVEGLSILLGHGENGVGLVIGITTHLLRIGVVAEGGARALEAILPPQQRFLAKRYADQARRWRGEEVEEALAGLLRVDELLKSSRMSSEHLLEGWLLERIARGAAAA